MIQIKHKKDCCGCEACVQRCPKSCISLVEDTEGFFYPEVDVKVCIDCNLCEKVCPVINQVIEQKPKQVYAAINDDECVRLMSSSGGVFSLLAETILDQGGVVFGVCWTSDWKLVFDYTENKDDLFRFRGSKYLQAHVGNAYVEVEQFLKLGRQVLFVGTSCQIKGLRLFLRKMYDNLLCVDIICHGVPSPSVFSSYLKEELTKGTLIKDIQFRDKRLGWKNFSFTISFIKSITEKDSNLLTWPFRENIYMKGFLKNFYLRPSCYACPAKSGKSESDITLGDWWGIDKLKPDFDDDKGVSAVVINTDKGQLWFDKLLLKKCEMDYNDLCLYNPAICKSVKLPPQRVKFYENYNKQSFVSLMNDLCRISYKRRFLNKIKGVFYKIYKD